MPAIYVLNVPEFQALAQAARAMPGCRVSPHGEHYLRIESDANLAFERKALGFKPAIWWGSLTGGLEGVIVHMDRDRLEIGPPPRSA